MTEAMKRLKEAIREYVSDHKKHFDTYPMDVEVDGIVYSWNEYWEILEEMNV